jgi:hypothetical protein
MSTVPAAVKTLEEQRMVPTINAVSRFMQHSLMFSPRTAGFPMHRKSRKRVCRVTRAGRVVSSTRFAITSTKSLGGSSRPDPRPSWRHSSARPRRSLHQDNDSAVCCHDPRNAVRRPAIMTARLSWSTCHVTSPRPGTCATRLVRRRPCFRRENLVRGVAGAQLLRTLMPGEGGRNSCAPRWPAGLSGKSGLDALS